MGKTEISWTDMSWNPVRGCSRVSEGCRNCYAERVAARFSGPGQPYEGLARRGSQTMIGKSRDRWTGVVRLIPEHLADPLRWRKPRRIFVNSMSDLFHESLTNEQIAAVFGVMAAAPQHTFQCLTKREKRMREWFELMHGDPLVRMTASLGEYMAVPRGVAYREPHDQAQRWPLPNVWLGVSVENQEAADERIPELLRVPAAVRFLSCEPLIGAVDVVDVVGRWWLDNEIDAIEARLDWVISGCESGPGARECKVEWLRSLRDQCAAAGVPYFLKQARETAHEHAESRVLGEVEAGPGSKRKAGGIIELPYLDGRQHAAFPEAVSQ